MIKKLLALFNNKKSTATSVDASVDITEADKVNIETSNDDITKSEITEKKKKKIRNFRRHKTDKSMIKWHLFQALGSANALIMMIILLLVGGFAILRFGTSSEFGRSRIEQALNGLPLGPIGKLYVKGLKGDAFTDLSLDYAAIKDEKGVWLDGQNIDVKWDAFDLGRRLVHLENVNAQKITVYRRPILTKSKKSNNNLPIAIQIDKLDANIETYEAISVKHGFWGVGLSLKLKRNKDMDIKGQITNAKRPTDFLKIDFQTQKAVPIHSDILISEANGGPIAGVLGLNADLPLSLKAQIQGGKDKGIIDIQGKNGTSQFANVKGGWGVDSGNFGGNINFAASHLTHAFAHRFGGAADIDAKWHKDENGKNNARILQINAKGPITDIKLSGQIDFEKRKTIGPLNVSLTTQQLRNMLDTMFMDAGAASFMGELEGSIDKFSLLGPVAARDYLLLGAHYKRVNGTLGIKFANKGDLEVDVNFNGNDNVGNGIISKLATNKVTGNVIVKHMAKGHVFVDELNVNSAGLAIKAKGGLSLFGNNSYLNGKGIIDAPILTDGILGGKIDGNFSAITPHNNMASTLKIDAIGNKLNSKVDLLNQVLGKSPKLNLNINIGEKGAYFTSLNLKAADIEAKGTHFDQSELMALIGGDLKIGNDTLKLFGLKGGFNGKFNLSGLHRLNGPNDFATLDLNLLGNEFATKVDILNQYITKKPIVRGKILIGLKRILASNLSLNSPDVNAIFDGQLVGNNDLAINTNWKINRPVALGPIELSSGLSGTGNIAGPYDKFLATFTAKANQLDIGGAIVSPASLSAQFQYGQSPMITKINFNGKSEYGDIVGNGEILSNKDSTSIRNINIQGAGIRAVGGATITSNLNPAADFIISINKGLLLQNGALNGRAKFERIGNKTVANIDFSGQKFAFRGMDLNFDSLQIRGNGPLNNLMLDTSFSAQSLQPISFNGKTLINTDNDRTNLKITGIGRIDGKTFSISDPIELMFAKNHKKASGKIALIGNNSKQSMLEFDGEQNGENLRLSADVADLNLSSLNQDFVGSFTGQLRARNSNNSIVGEIDGKLLNARARGLKDNMAINGDINARLNNEILSIKTNLNNASGFEMVSDINLPALTSVTPLRFAIVRTKPMNGNIQLNGEVSPLADLVFAGQRYLSGHMVANSTISGTINDPMFNGKFTVNNGKYREPDIGLTLIGLNLNGTIDPEKIDILKFNAKDNKRGEVEGEGQLGLRGDSGSNFNINMRKFRVIDNDIAQVDTTGAVNLQHLGGSNSKLTGKLRIDFAEISPRSLSGTSVSTIDVKEKNIPEDLKPISFANGKTTKVIQHTQSNRNIELAVNLKADRGIFIRGRGLNLELSMNSDIHGTLNKPNIDGVAKVFRGEYEYGGRIFEFEDRGTITLDERPENIRLNLSANRETDTLKAYININGTAAKPEISLTSNPSLPADEILAQVLFGRSKSQLTSFEAVQLASSLAALASGGGFDVMANLREFARLDRLVFGNNSLGEITVAGGKYLGRDVYLEIISQGTEGVDTKVEWRPVRSTAIVSTVSTKGDARISVRWRRDIK